MPRKTSFRNRGRDLEAAVGNGPPSPALETPAGAPNVYLQTPRDGRLDQLVRALGAYEPALQNAVADEAEADTVAAAKAVAAGEELQPEASPAFRSTYMSLRGQREGLRAADELTAAYETEFDKDAGNIDEFLNSWVAKDVQGAEDQDFLKGYLPVVEQAKTRLRTGHSVEAAQKVQQTAIEDVHGLLLEEFSAAAKNGRPLSVEQLNARYEQGRALNLTNQDMNLVAVEAARLASIEHGPAVFDVFDQPKPDGTPGLTKTKAWGMKIAAYREQAAAVQREKKEKQDAVLQFRAFRSAYDKAEQGALGTGELENLLKGNLISEGEAKSLYGLQTESAKRIQTTTQMQAAIRASDLASLAQLEASRPDGASLAKTGFQKFADEALAGAADDSEQAAMAAAMIADRGAKLGQTYAPWKARLGKSNPASPQFEQDAILYANLKAANPVYAGQYVDNEQALLFDTYWTMRNAGGADPQTARQVALQMASPEGRESAKQLREGGSGAKMRAKIKADLVSNTFAANTKNAGYVQQAVTDLALLNLSMGNSDFDAARSWAMERFKATHTKLKDRWVHTGDLPMLAGLPDATDWYTAERAKQRGEAADPKGYYIMPDRRTLADGTWGVYGESNDWPEPVRVDPRKLVSSFHKSQAPSAEALIEQHADKKATRKLMEGAIFTTATPP